MLLLLIKTFAIDWSVYAVTAVTVPPMVVSMVYVIIPFARRFERQRA